MLQRCSDCGAYRWTPQYLCRDCHSERYAWVETSGRGTLYSWSVVYRPPLPAFEPGYVLAVIEVDEGPLMLSNLVGADADELAIGMPVRAVFEPLSDEITLYRFQLA